MLSRLQPNLLLLPPLTHAIDPAAAVEVNTTATYGSAPTLRLIAFFPPHRRSFAELSLSLSVPLSASSAHDFPDWGEGKPWGSTEELVKGVSARASPAMEEHAKLVYRDDT